MLRKMRRRLHPRKRTWIEAPIREFQPGGIAFLLSQGFEFRRETELGGKKQGWLPDSAGIALLSTLPDYAARDYLEECGGGRELVLDSHMTERDARWALEEEERIARMR